MPKNLIIKIISAGVLLIITVVLLMIYIKPTGDKHDNITQENNKKNLINEEEVKKKVTLAIDSLISQFGIKKEWVENVSGKENLKSPVPVKKNKVKEKTIPNINNNLWFAKKVSIPVDLSVAEVNIDINNYLRDYYCLLTASEDLKKNSITSEIYFIPDTTKKLVGKIIFEQSKDLKRDVSDICLVLNKLENLPEQDINKILSSPEKFSVILPDDIEKSDIQAKIFDARKDYLLYFDTGSEKDIDADFRSDMKPGEWKSKVKTMFNEYSKASAIILSPRRSIPKFENEIKEEFIRYSSNIFSDTIFVKFESKEKSPRKINELINDIIVKTNKGYKVIFYLVNFSPDDLSEYTSQIYVLKKKGFRFKIFGDAIKKTKE
jgi:hypothetical protein